MSRYIYRFIELKIENKWHWIVFENPLFFEYSNIKNNFSSSKLESNYKKIKIRPNLKLNCNKNNKSSVLLNDEYGYSFVQSLNDEFDNIFNSYFSDDNEYSTRGIPGDISERLQIYLNEIEGYNVTSIELEELQLLYDSYLEDMTNSILDSDNTSFLKSLHIKIDLLLKANNIKNPYEISKNQWNNSYESRNKCLENLIDKKYHNLSIFNNLLQRLYVYIDIVSQNFHIENARYIFVYK